MKGLSSCVVCRIALAWIVAFYLGVVSAAEPEAAACVIAPDKLQFPTTAGSVKLELTGEITPVSPSPIDVFSYGTLVKAFDRSVFALVPNPLVLSRFKVTNDGTDKLISLAYSYKRGTRLYVL